jgi:hypothetical protein
MVTRRPQPPTLEPRASGVGGHGVNQDRTPAFLPWNALALSELSWCCEPTYPPLPPSAGSILNLGCLRPPRCSPSSFWSLALGELPGHIPLNMAVHNTEQTLRLGRLSHRRSIPNQTTLEITGSRLRRSRTVRHLHLGTAKAHLRSLFLCALLKIA